MKLPVTLLSIVCATSLFAATETPDTSTKRDSTEQATQNTSTPDISCLKGISPKNAAVAVGLVGLSYWVNKNLKDFFKKAPNGILPAQCEWLNSSNYGPTLVREMITAGLFTTSVLGLKTLIAHNFVDKAAQISGDGKLKNGPKWFEKAWTTGLTLAFAHLAYEVYNGSLAPDIIKSTKDTFGAWFKSAPTK